MKTKYNSISLLAMGMLLVSFLSACNKDNLSEDNNLNGGGRGFHAIAEGDGGKTYLDGTAVKWEKDETISVRNDAGLKQVFHLDKGVNTSYGTFESDEVSNDFFVPNYTAIYPTASTDGVDNVINSDATATFDLPPVQTYKANSFGVKAMPMMACSTDEVLEFKNVLGGVVFPLTYTSESEDYIYYKVKSVVVTSNNSADVLWGTCTTTISGLDDDADLSSTVANNASDKHIITLDCSADGGVELIKDTPIDFTVMVPAGTLESGFTLTVIGDLSCDGVTYAGIELYTQSVSWNNGQQPDFIVRSRLSKVKTAIDVKLLVGYIVRYIDMDTRIDILPPFQSYQTYEVGSCVTAASLPVEGYRLIGPASHTFDLGPITSENIITFYYQKFELRK